MAEDALNGSVARLAEEESQRGDADGEEDEHVHASTTDAFHGNRQATRLLAPAPRKRHGLCSHFPHGFGERGDHTLHLEPHELQERAASSKDAGKEAGKCRFQTSPEPKNELDGVLAQQWQAKAVAVQARGRPWTLRGPPPLWSISGVVLCKPTSRLKPRSWKPRTDATPAWRACWLCARIFAHKRKPSFTSNRPGSSFSAIP